MTDATRAKTRVCLKCKQAKEAQFFPSTSSPYFPGKHSIICTACLEKMARADDWDAIDRLFRWLDLPFDIELWARLYKSNGEHTLTAYLNFIDTNEAYKSISWKDENKKWRDAKEGKTIEEQIPEIQEAQLRALRARWSDSYTVEEYQWLENLYTQIVATQNVSTPILQDYAKDYCEISLRIKKKIRNGEDVKKEMDSRDNIIKVAGFEAKNAINVGDFDSVGELITYFVKKGWQPNWAQEKKDVVDFTMHNIQQYLNRLVTNEGGLAEQVEQRREAYNTAKRLEEAQLNNDEELKRYEETDENVVYEGEDELAYDLSEYDL